MTVPELEALRRKQRRRDCLLPLVSEAARKLYPALETVGLLTFWEDMPLLFHYSAVGRRLLDICRCRRFHEET